MKLLFVAALFCVAGTLAAPAPAADTSLTSDISQILQRGECSDYYKQYKACKKEEAKAKKEDKQCERYVKLEKQVYEAILFAFEGWAKKLEKCKKEGRRCPGVRKQYRSSKKNLAEAKRQYEAAKEECDGKEDAYEAKKEECEGYYEKYEECD